MTLRSLAWQIRTMLKLFNSSTFVLVYLLLAGCSLTESSKEEVNSHSLVSTHATSANVIVDNNYLESCRAKGVPIPPDWKPAASDWERHGNLHTILLTPNTLDQAPVDETSFASVWSYAPPQGRGACIALGRNGGSFQVICQSATTGYACFWSNDPLSPATSWTPETAGMPMISLRDPVQGFAPGTAACTDCHRGNNAFLYAPDDPTWATVLRPEQRRQTFTTQIEQSFHHGQLIFGATTTTYPRFIPIGGKAAALHNPLPTITGCSGSCHELHLEIFQKNRTAEGYVRIPRPMGPNCAQNSPPDDPTRNCYHRNGS